jgi:hypothetical protein
VATRSLRSSRLSFEDRDPRIALQTEGGARTIPRIFQHRDQVVTELAAEAAPNRQIRPRPTPIERRWRGVADPVPLIIW